MFGDSAKTQQFFRFPLKFLPHSIEAKSILVPVNGVVIVVEVVVAVAVGEESDENTTSSEHGSTYGTIWRILKRGCHRNLQRTAIRWSQN